MKSLQQTRNRYVDIHELNSNGAQEHARRGSAEFVKKYLERTVKAASTDVGSYRINFAHLYSIEITPHI